MTGTSIDTTATGPASALFDKVRHLHPNLQFCGIYPNELFTLRDELVSYIFALLGEKPVSAPDASPEEWARLIETLQSHWILPLLFWQVGHVPTALRPHDQVTESLRVSFQWSRVRAMQMERQLNDIITAFRDAGVRFLILKGVALGRMVYPDPATRPGSDIDILVRPEDMLRSREILEQQGYRCIAQKFGTGVEALNHHEEFISNSHSRQDRLIELHWRLHFFDISQNDDVADFFDRAVQVSSIGFTFEALHPVDAIIHRALNNAFMHDHDIRLIWVYDIFLLARNLRNPDDWRVLQERCVICRARMAVEMMLTLASAWYGLALPKQFADFSMWPEPSAEERTAWKRIVNRHKRFRIMIGAHLPRYTNIAERVRLIYYLFLPPPAVILLKYPVSHPWMLPIAYIRRWIRWLRVLRS